MMERKTGKKDGMRWNGEKMEKSIGNFTQA